MVSDIDEVNAAPAVQRRENVDRGKLIEVIDSHKQEEIIKALKQQPLEVREQVEEVSVDMWVTTVVRESGTLITP